jgi:hypothetical protein
MLIIPYFEFFVNINFSFSETFFAKVLDNLFEILYNSEYAISIERNDILEVSYAGFGRSVR